MSDTTKSQAMKKLKIIGKILGLILQFINKTEEDLVLIWISDRFCLVDTKKAFVYRLAKSKGVHFDSSDHFESWYEEVKESTFAIEDPKKSIVYYGKHKTIPLYWI